MTTSVQFCWWCPSAGTQEYLTSGEHAYLQSFDYIQMVAKKCESYGFDDILLPISARCLEPTVVATIIGRETSSLNMMLAVRPGHWNPVHFARSIASLQLLYPQRIKINYVEGNTIEMIAEGDRLHPSERITRQNEFIEITDRLLSGEAITYDGNYYKIDNCQLPKVLCPEEKIKSMISGHSNEIFDLAIKGEDSILVYGGALETIAEYISSVKKINNNYSHSIGMSIQIFARETKEEAEAAAQKFISRVMEKHINKSINYHATKPLIDKVHVDTLKQNNYWMTDVLWYGLIKGRIHQRASLVGSYSSVANELINYKNLGISYFIITAEPNDTELNHIGKKVLPLFKQMLTK